MEYINDVLNIIWLVVWDTM